ncbi:mannose-1-phosphate guanylyltransferase/mannose-6-phosphate isomerase [uncultured Nitrosomonas sp.]|uniref:mannose-1-phosphate guanylyltransferase/mannose-6-phosphate isomerase n=1 Tax=uncultured Nitrosomonas sp. TaxID=156424 RepID=UPI002614DC1D|nr:mannose-1-phosphate guanylyltransferase/mannose-6-phosphate isomerase [uncultured Nitrosomonas sp.]
MNQTLTPVILSGGSGTRLWPLSRQQYPKQLLPLVNQYSLLQETARRLDGLDDISVQSPIIVSNEEYRFVIAEQLRVLGKTGKIILEPFGRNTAPALTIAALAAMHGGNDPILLVMPSDHVITDISAFQEAVHKGMSLAENGMLVTFGITPDTPETGYGYIQYGSVLHEPGTFRIARFVEKPDLATAQSYLEEGSYLWNSGMFMMRASIWLEAIEICRRDMLDACRAAWQPGSVDGDFYRIDKTAFAACPGDSIDYAVMEPLSAHLDTLPPGAIIPLSAGWSDIGAWDALWRTLPKDESGNVVRGDVLLHECHDTLAFSENRLVACIGVENVVIVETSDAILVAHQDKTQEVKHIVDLLKQRNRPEIRAHRKIYRPWGWYDSIDMGERFQVKRIVVNPGAALSLQMHHHRAEHWIVVRGTAQVTRADKTFLVSENESTFIPLGTPHRLENPGRVPLEMIEVQSGSYLGEDDIVRFEDKYGRKEN